MERLGASYASQNPKLLPALVGLADLIHASTLGERLLDLVFLRASQLNGCAFCAEMHAAEAVIHGETNERLLALPVWRESGRFTPRERAALALTEAATRLEHGVPDEVYAAAREAFEAKELVELTFAIAVINAFNRLNVTFRTPAERGRELVLAQHARRGG